MLKKKINLKNIIKISMVFSIIFAAIYIIRNLDFIPEYGDTPEFIKLSQDFNLDGYRTFIFPLILNICIRLGNLFNIQYTYILYMIQNIISMLSCAIFLKSIYYTFDKKIKKIEWALYSLFLWSIPFNVHFNMTVLADSLAISFSLCFLAFLIYFIKNNKISYGILTLLFMYLVSNTRSEKIYFCVFVLLFTILGLIIVNRKTILKIKNIKKLVMLCMIIVLGITGNAITNKWMKSSKKEDNSRTQPELISFISQRIMKYNLEDMYQYFPEEITRTITYEDAVNNGKASYCGIYEKLVNEDNNTSRVVLLLKTVLKHNWYNILLDINSDFIKNVFPVFYQMFECREGAFQWTITRMQGEHPVYTTAYIIYSNILCVIIFIFILYKIIMNNYKININKSIDLLPIILYILISAIFFACLTSQNFHIRYVMPSYMMEMGLIIVILNKINKEI